MSEFNSIERINASDDDEMEYRTNDTSFRNHFSGTQNNSNVGHQSVTVGYKMMKPKYDRSFNFNIPYADEYELQPRRAKGSRDPQSHRIIEKRRRDRMNNCLGDLSKLIPPTYLKQGQGRIEKTEIIELAIIHIKQLQAMVNCLQGGNTDRHEKIICQENFLMGFRECTAELMRFLVEVDGHNAADTLCVKMRNYLEEQGLKFAKRSVYIKEDTNQCADTCLVHSSGCDSGTNGTTQDDTYQNTLKSNCEKGNDPNETPSDVNTLDKTRVEDTPDSPVFNSSFVETDFNASYSSSQTGSEKSKEIYKFKNDIKLRFTSRCNKRIAASATENEHFGSIQVDQPYKKCPRSSPSSEQSAYPISDNSSNGNASSNGRRYSESSGRGTDISPSETDGDQIKREHCEDIMVPAFALHPSGTHYVPITVTSNKLIAANVTHSVTNVYHPISIPVNFSGSFIGVRNLNVQSSVDCNFN